MPSTVTVCGTRGLGLGPAAGTEGTDYGVLQLRGGISQKLDNGVDNDIDRMMHINDQCPVGFLQGVKLTLEQRRLHEMSSPNG